MCMCFQYSTMSSETLPSTGCSQSRCFEQKHVVFSCKTTFVCTGAATSCQLKVGQRSVQPRLISCSASTVDQFGRSNEASSSALQSSVAVVLSNLQALYQFSRPHTMLGTFISICSVSLLAMVGVSRPISRTAVPFAPASATHPSSSHTLQATTLS